MPNLNQNLLGAGAHAKNDFASASAETSLTFTGEAQLRRGLEVEIGIGALATADAGLGRFVDAMVRGNAFAEAKASLQLQMPLNLFEEFGVVVGAEAVAQAAAGIEAELALNVGDFIALLQRSPDGFGVPMDLVLLLLDEAKVGGRFEVHVAASAMAYASLKLTGEISDPKKAGFHVFADAGLGLAAGVGFSGGLDLGISDFRRFYGRAVDRVVDSVVEQVRRPLAGANPALLPVAEALSPFAKTALRVAYEIGAYLAKNKPGHGKQDAADLANHCVGVVLEEAQRFLFSQLLVAGLGTLERLVEENVQQLAQGSWDALLPARRDLAHVLQRMPAEPFQPTMENASYWAELLAKAAVLLSRLPVSGGGAFVRGATWVFCAAELLRKATESRINQAGAYAFAIGAGRASLPPPDSFEGPLHTQPGTDIRSEIERVLGSVPPQPPAAPAPLTYTHLLDYLLADETIDAFRAAVPALDAYIAPFQRPPIANDARAVLRVLLRNREAFVRNAGGDRDPQETLRALLGAIDAFVDLKVHAELVPAVHARVTDENARLYFDEVLLGALAYTKNLAFRSVLDWEKAPVDRAAFTEALAGIITMMLGRSLVLVADGFLHAVATNMSKACEHAAQHLDGPKNAFIAMGLRPSPELKALLVDTLRVGGEVFGPLPEQTRKHLRYVLYDVFETLPPNAAAQAELTENLADQFFIPNQEALGSVADELLAISRDRFQLFVERVLESAGTLLLHAIQDLLEEARRAVEAWFVELERARRTLHDRLAALDAEIQRLAAEARLKMNRAVDHFDALLGALANRTFRDRLRRAFAEHVFRSAKAVLADNGAYRALPKEARTFARDFLRERVEDAVEGPLLDPLFAALGSVAGQWDGVLDDLRELDPDAALAPQLRDLVIERLEESAREHFGGGDPRVPVGFTLSVFGQSVAFRLGSVQVPLAKMFSILRDVFAGAGLFEDELHDASEALASAMRARLGLTERQDERERARADTQRIERIRGEFSPSEKRVVIVSPAPSSVHTGGVDVCIHLGGVPASYLGLERDEQERVLVIVNGDVVPLTAMQIEHTSPTPSPAPAVRSASVAGRPQRTLPGRRPSTTARAGLVNALPGGITLRFRAGSDHVLTGANTLAVVVLDPNGEQFLSSTSFGVTTPKSPTLELRDLPRLPVMPGRRRGPPPAEPKDRIPPVFRASTLEAKVEAARTRVKRQADAKVRELRER